MDKTKQGGRIQRKKSKGSKLSNISQGLQNKIPIRHVVTMDPVGNKIECKDKVNIYLGQEIEQENSLFTSPLIPFSLLILFLFPFFPFSFYTMHLLIHSSFHPFSHSSYIHPALEQEKKSK